MIKHRLKKFEKLNGLIDWGLTPTFLIFQLYCGMNKFYKLIFQKLNIFKQEHLYILLKNVLHSQILLEIRLRRFSWILWFCSNESSLCLGSLWQSGQGHRRLTKSLTPRYPPQLLKYLDTYPRQTASPIGLFHLSVLSSPK